MSQTINLRYDEPHAFVNTSKDLPDLDFNRETLDKDLIEATRQRIRAIQVGQFGMVDASGLSVVIVK